MTVVLVVGADAEPSVATDDLLDLLAWVRRVHPTVELHVLLRRGGPRIHRFHELAPTTVVDWYDRRADHRGAAVVLRGRRKQRWLARLVDRASAAALDRHLPRVGADVVLVVGRDALAAGTLMVDASVPRVLLADGAARASLDELAPQDWAELERVASP